MDTDQIYVLWRLPMTVAQTIEAANVRRLSGAIQDPQLRLEEKDVIRLFDLARLAAGQKRWPMKTEGA